MDHVHIPDLLRYASLEFILPRFKRLAAKDIEEKTPGELVTSVDRDVEAFLAPELRALVAGSVVVGEEASSAAPEMLECVTAEEAWLIDPLDGAGNFIEGSGDFAILVARLHKGRCISSWMYRPLDETLYVAELGGGAWADGTRLRIQPTPTGRLGGIVKTRFLPPGLKERVLEGARAIDTHPGANCTAVDYPRICSGECGFALYWRTLPWDHAAPALWLEEAGGVVRRLDGTTYVVGDKRDGLLAARDDQTWQQARSVLMR